MSGHTFRVLLAGVLLVPLAWIGIVIVAKLHGRGMLVPVLVIWGLIAAADLGFAVLSVKRARRLHVQHTPEPTTQRNH